MRFDDGKEAFSFFIEQRNNYEITRISMLQRLMEDNGGGFEYKANGRSNSNPAWAQRIDAVCDIENILKKHFARDEVKIMVERALFGFGESKRKPDFFKDGVGLRAKEKRFKKAMEKFERRLKKERYLREIPRPKPIEIEDLSELESSEPKNFDS